ncbi:MAG: carboxypeptidase regulatory-like domain-containing protein, partial [Anaerolineae bacterium]|nr:carboxypeptidase regulatory-like domain-containing protein [Anaerolineae bacterium]
MNFRKLFNLLFAVVFVLSLLPTVALAQEDVTAQPVATIEAELLADLAEGPADFVVEMAEKADLSKAYEMDDWSARGWYVYNTLTSVAKRSQSALKAYLDDAHLEYKTFIAGNLLYVRDGTLSVANALAAMPGVEAIRLPRVYQIDPPVARDTVLGDPVWGILDTQAPDFWTQFGMKGDGIVVANIDTGVDYMHDALLPNYHCAGGTHDNCWYDPGTVDCTGPGGGPCDTIYAGIYHGSHTMGTMAAKDDPALSYTVGMAPNAQWIACLGCPFGSCPDFDLNECADWILAPGGNPDNRPHIVNNSWGGGGGDAWYLGPVQAWRAAGVFPAFSAGNSGSSCGTLGSPGDYQESFGSAAHDVSRNIASFSSRGPGAFGDTPHTKPNISAPGVNVISTQPGNSWGSIGGTSMASPHSAGAVALLWSCNPSLIGQIEETFAILQDNADTPPAGNCGAPPSGLGNYTYGRGYLNVYQAGLLWCGDTGYLDGHVYDATTSNPIADATVDAGGPTATTDATGYYTMTLMAGTYTVTATHPLYTDLAISGVVVTTNTVATQDFNLQPRGRLWGYVLDQDSLAPLEATVTADDGTWADTDPATGMYEMYLDPGTYDVTAEATDYASATVSVNVVSGLDTQQDFALLAAIAVVPDPIAISLEMGTTGSVGAVITNNMIAVYPFEFIEVETTVDGEIEAVGGPDPFGYTYKDSLEPDGPQYNFVDISTTGTSVAMGDDDYEGPLPLGFTFTFYGNDYTSFYAGSNGFLSFGAGSTSLSNQNLPSTTDPDNLIALMWDDLDPGDTGDLVYYQTFSPCPYPGGTACTIVQYENYHHYPGGGAIAGTWEAILFDNGNILVQFEDVGAEAGLSSTTGIENSDGTVGLTYVYNTASLVDLSAVCFQHPDAPPCGGGDIPWFSTSVTTGTVPAGGSLGWNNTFSATAAAGIDQPGVYEGLLIVNPTGANLPSKQVPVVMEVTAPPTYGLLDGTVTSERTGEPLEIEVFVEGSGGMTWTIPTDPATGYYSYWLDTGTYTVTADAAGYISETAVVGIAAGLTTTQDFALELDAPWIDFDKDAYDQTLEFGLTAVEPFTITNLGPEELTWEISEVDNGMTPLAQCEEVYGSTASPWGPGGARDRGNIFEASEDTVISEIRVYLNFTTATDLYFVVYEGNAVTGSYTQINATHVTGVGPGQGWYTSGPIAVPAEAGKFYYVGASWNGSANYYRGTELTPITTNCFGVLHTGIPGSLAGYPPAPTINNTYASGGFSPYYFAIVTGGGDVPWLAETPISGTVPANTTFTGGEVHFDAGAVPEPGIYMADLRVASNDPLEPQVTVPVTLTVLPSANIGKLEGTVTSDRPGGPLEAEILIESAGGMTWTATTDPDTGYYYHWLNLGFYDVTASAAGYLSQTATVEILSQMTTTQDFQLVLNQPDIAVTPPSMEEVLVFGDTAVQTMTITNEGVAPLDFEISEMDRGMVPIHIPAFKGTLPQDTAPASTGRAPNAPVLMGEVGSLPFILAGEPAFALDVYPGYNLVYWPDTTAPGTWNIVGSVPQFHPAGDFLNGDFSTLYALDYDTNEFVAIDTTTGVRTVIGTAVGNGNWSGMTGAGDGTLYASSSVCGTSSTLYTIDPATGMLTTVGNIGAGSCIIDIAINAAGEMYGIDIITDQLWQIDPMTGVGTPVGALGVSANYAQGMDFEEDTGVLYWAAYTTQGELRIIDTATGASTLVGPFPGGNEVDALAFATGGGGGEVPWLAEMPVSGTVPAASSLDVAVSFDSGVVAEPGEYWANLKVSSNDPYQASVMIPVTMTVLPAGDIGKLEGTVIGTGYCDGESYPLEATLVMEASDGMTYTTTSDPATGYYYRWLDAGTYTVTATAADHLPATDVAVVQVGMTTTLDLSLRYIESCMDVTPTSFSLTLPVDYVFTDALTIWNNGAGPLMWEIKETTATMALLGDPTVNAPQADNDVAPTSLTVLGPLAVGEEVFNVDVQTPTGDNQLLGVEWALGYWWVTGGNSGLDPNKLYKIDVNGTLVDTFDVPASATGWGWRDLAWDGTYLYGSASNAIDCFDPVSEVMTPACLTGPQNPNRALAYDPATDHFWTANFGSNIYEFDRSGTIVNQYPNTLAIYGAAWDMYSPGGPYLWVWSQDAAEATLVLATQIDPATGLPTGVSFVGT